MRRGAWVSKLGQYLVVFWLAVTINFTLPRLAPGDPALMLYTGEGIPSAETLEEIRKIYGLEGSVLSQYLNFWGNLLQGDLGLSTGHNRPVTDILLERLPWSITLIALGLGTAVLLGALLGAWSAWRRTTGRTGSDKGMMVTVLGFNSMPGFWLAMLLITLFSAKLGWFPSYSMTQMSEAGLPWLIEMNRSLFMPVLTTTLATFGGYYLLARASMITVLGEPFIRMARAKGLAENAIAIRHAQRTALLPVATNAAMAAGAAVSGAVVIETVFSFPGLGKVIADAVTARDYPLLQGAFLLATIGVIAANILADAIYPLLDPRVRNSKEVIAA